MTTVENNATPASPAAADPAPAAAPAGDENLLGDPASTVEGGENKAPENDDDDLLEGKVKAEEQKQVEDIDYGEFKIPEGFEADADLANSFKPVAKELGLSKDQAQGLVEKFAPQMLAQIAEKQAAQWKAVQKTWANEAKSDPDFGGKNLEGSLASVARARDYLGADFASAIKLLGGSNHPAVLKALAKVGQALSEDTPGFGSPTKGSQTREQRLYPNDQPKS